MPRLYLGVDLACENDYAAITLLEQNIGIFAVHGGSEYRTTYAIRHLQRFPLKTEYPVIAQELITMMRDPGLSSDGVLILDETGVGRPFRQMLEAEGLHPVGITITGGMEEMERDGNTFSVPKKNLVSSLILLFQSGKLKISPGLEYARVFEDELRDFHYKIDKKTANISYEARHDATHDDLVMSAALATWYASKHEQTGFHEHLDEETDDYDPRTWGLER